MIPSISALFTFAERSLERRIPPGIEGSVQRSLDFAGEDVPARKWLARNALMILLLSALYSTAPFVFPVFFTTSLAPYITQDDLSLLSAAIFVASVVLFAAVAYFSVYYRIDARRSRSQEVLPFFLSAVATNLEAGIEPLSALYVSLRPEFSPITDEMRKVRSLALGPKSIVDQLSLIRGRIDSTSLHMAITIIERAARSGGNLARILENIARDIRESNELQRELRTATRGYIYLILFLALAGVPLLLGVAATFVKFVTAPGVTQTELGAAFLGFLAYEERQPAQPVGETIDLIFAVLLALGAVNASLILGVLWTGEAKAGVKYMPVLLPLSVALYFLFATAIKGLLGAFGILEI